MIFGVQGGFSKIFKNVFSNYFFGGGKTYNFLVFLQSKAFNVYTQKFFEVPGQV